MNQKGEPIQVYHRQKSLIETEQIYGEGPLRWAYHHPLGRLTVASVVKRLWFSRFYGWLMSRSSSRKKIIPFIRQYGLNTEEFEQTPTAFESFNQFFSRKLKKSARPIHPDPRVIVFPADGRHLGFPDASRVDGVYVKGQKFDLEGLLRDSRLAAQFAHGTVVISRLSPTDYHRFHFPVTATAGAARLINGPLSSVNPIALRDNLAILCQNKRLLSVLESPLIGRIVMLEIGATNVGSVRYTYEPGVQVVKGQEKGFFQFGGSMIVTLFQKDRVTLDRDLINHSRQNRELYALMGERLGAAT